MAGSSVYSQANNLNKSYTADLANTKTAEKASMPHYLELTFHHCLLGWSDFEGQCLDSMCMRLWWNL